MVTYNGETTNLSGEGSPNPVKLTLPSLDKVQDPAVQACLLRIQQWLNNLIAPSGGGGGAYASLTGPGETTTPGDLTQAGGFTVNADGSLGESIDLNTVKGTTTIQTTNPSVPTDYAYVITSVGTSAPSGHLNVGASLEVNIHAGTGPSGIIGGQILIEALGSISIEGGNVAINGAFGIFGSTPITQPTVTGSRAGNAALASLLTALANFGFIINSSTP